MSTPDKTTPKIGTLLDGTEGRDAVHIALAPVQAGEQLRPGQRVAVTNSRTKFAFANVQRETTIGIVDPFLRTDVEMGQWFYLFLDPGTITSLRHVWSHPAFQTKVPGDG